MRLYRVFPFDAEAKSSEPGGALFAPRNGTGRIANPKLYTELYVSSTAAAALSEAFGRFDTWTEEMLAGPDRPYALATYELKDDRVAVCDLDNAARLLAYDLRPSEVVARDRTVTQAWAGRIYRSGKWAGISWWSRYDSRWRSLGLWNLSHLRLSDLPELLTIRHTAVREAAELLPRRLDVVV
ncbi:MAG TPA: RES domain-containing protein [Candidatus Cybelea sp.]